MNFLSFPLNFLMCACAVRCLPFYIVPRYLTRQPSKTILVLHRTYPCAQNKKRLTPVHLSRQTLTTPLKRTKLLSGNLKALNLARKRSPSSVKKFSNKYGSTEHLKKIVKYQELLLPKLGSTNIKIQKHIPKQSPLTHSGFLCRFHPMAYINDQPKFYPIPPPPTHIFVQSLGQRNQTTLGGC